MPLIRSVLVALVLLTPVLAFPAEAAWETITTRPILIKTRPRAGSDVREVWAEGDMRAHVQDLQAALLDVNRYASFMPYMKETRELPPRDADGTFYAYSRLQLPIVGGRDYVLKIWVPKSVQPDGSGSFMNTWVCQPDRVPRKSGVTRLKVNEGSWTITPGAAAGMSHAVYRFAVDPGGWLPQFAADFGNKSAVEDTWTAVEKEGQRRAVEAAKNRPAPPRP